VARIEAEWRAQAAAMRLRDRIRPGIRVLFVGINPGLRSAWVGHHFAGPSNRFWKLLWESGLVDEPLTYADDVRLGEWGFGITNLVPRTTAGVSDLAPREFVVGWRLLERKIRRVRPEVVALIGVTLYRAILPLVGGAAERGTSPQLRTPLGLQPCVIHGARVFVLPNPSGRNAHYRYQDMLESFAALATYLRETQHTSAEEAGCPF
jgi:TDG/mug DNA glycosylase family protein